MWVNCFNNAVCHIGLMSADKLLTNIVYNNTKHFGFNYLHTLQGIVIVHVAVPRILSDFF